LSVSSIEPRKNIRSVLDSWSRIVDSIPEDISLVLVGPSNPSIFADVDLNVIPPRVFFTGFVDDADLPIIYQNAFLFIYLSLYEGFGLPP
ncbi:glycosyltransferase, partial [Shewanella sp. A25]|nr:glycosyltransferase [Shewanella shenzhenensis]